MSTTLNTEAAPFTTEQIEWLKKNLTVSVSVTSWGTVDVTLSMEGETFCSSQGDITFPSGRPGDY